MSPAGPRFPAARTPVAIVGAGPVGLALALGLSRHGVASTVLERKPSTSERSKAPAIHVRTREVLGLWGVEERFLEAGVFHSPVTMHSVERRRGPLLTLDFSDLEDEADRPGLLVLEQGETERLLLEAVREAGLARVRFGAEAVALEPGPDGCRVRFRREGADHTLEADYVVGCDGAGSFVRDALGLRFEGGTYRLRPMLADVRVEDARDALPSPRAWAGRGGFAFAVRLRAGLWRIVHIEPPRDQAEEVSPEEARVRVDRLLGPGPFTLEWGSRFRIHRRASPTFRVGRVLLAGDAAHVHSPASGFGMNGGIHDAHNLAWKLASALAGGDREGLLDSYDVERRAVMVGQVSGYTDLITRGFLQVPGVVRRAVFAVLRTAMRVRPLRRLQARRTAMLDLDYPASPLLREGDRAAGVRLPNVALEGPAGAPRRLYDLLPAAAPALLELGETRAAVLPHTIRIGPGGWRDPAGRLRELLGSSDGWILVRPDAHVAWARRDPEGMEEAVGRALGAAGRRPA